MNALQVTWDALQDRINRFRNLGRNAEADALAEILTVSVCAYEAEVRGAAKPRPPTHVFIQDRGLVAILTPGGSSVEALRGHVRDGTPAIMLRLRLPGGGEKTDSLFSLSAARAVAGALTEALA